MTWPKCFIFLILFIPHTLQAQNVEVDVLGLFKNAALLKISGREKLLRVGEHAGGVTLIAANSKGAVIDLNGRQIPLTLSSRIGTSFEAPDKPSVSMLLSDRGQYRTDGRINGRSVQFLVDTGATVVAMSSKAAASLGISLKGARQVPVVTASGRVASYAVTLEQVQVGSISVRNVQAAVIEGGYPEDILLGMSFLRNVNIQENAGVMQLNSKF